MIQRAGRMFSIDQTLDAQWIGVFQGFGQKGVRVVLEADRAQEAINRQCAHRCAARIRGCRVRPAMNHGVSDFHTRGIAVQQDPSDLFLQQLGQPAVFEQLIRFTEDGGRQLPAQTIERCDQLRLVSDFNNDRGRPEYFFLEQFVTVEQQAGVGFEQLRLSLLTLLRTSRQVFHSRMTVQML